MCEPAHSIVQFRIQHLNEQDTDLTAQSNRNLSGLFAGLSIQNSRIYGTINWGKEIDKWILMSRLGSGHHGAMEKVRSHTSLASIFLMPEHALYENNWWERKTKRDGFGGNMAYSSFSNINTLNAACYSTYETPPDDMRTDEALNAADQYAKEVSTGSIRAFRSFLTHSIRNSERPQEYLSRFMLMLNKEGKDDFKKRSKNIFCTASGGAVELGRLMTTPQRTKQITDFTLGYTRKRNLLVPEWSDDDSVWDTSRNSSKNKSYSMSI
jgi:hypothetical protein